MFSKAPFFTTGHYGTRLRPFRQLKCICPQRHHLICINIGSMAATNDKGKGKAFFKAILPLLALLIALVYVFFLWHYYHPNRTINFHQTRVSQLVHSPERVRRQPRLSA
jgi:hypothetical protein